MPGSQQDLDWLRGDRSLEELQERFPDDWLAARGRLLAASETGRPGYDRLLAEIGSRDARHRDRAPSVAQRVSSTAQQRMIRLALQAASDRRESGVEEGAIRFRRFDGAILQRVLFAEGLVRKPVRLPAFRIAWRLARQRDRLLPIVRQQGIWCFYSAALVRRFVRLIGDRSAVEVGAGDGTLTRFLRDAGADVVATDDHSWSGRIDFPSWVEQADARAVLRRGPEVVLCSWPPAGNTFEADILAAPSVRTYIAIVSSDPRESGSPAAYAQQSAFDMTEDPALSRLVLPPGRNRVLVFQRRPGA